MNTLNDELIPQKSLLDGWELNGLILKSQDYNGHWRESAVRQLREYNHIDSIRAIIVRTNDWVPQVREVAKSTLLNMLTAENVNSLIKLFPEIYHLRNCRRLKSAPIIRAIERFLGSTQNINELEAGVHHCKAMVALICTRLLIKYKLIPIDRLVNLSQGSKHNIIRLKGAELFQRVEKNQLRGLLNTALNDRFMPVRKRAAQLLIKDGNENAELLAQYLLLDQHHEIRNLAITFLREKQFSFDSFYTKRLDSTNIATLKCAIWAIGELRLLEQSQVLITYLKSEYPSVRKQALSALYHLESDEIKTILIEAITDESLTVRQTSTRLIKKVAYMFKTKDFKKIISSSLNVSIFASIIRACRCVNKWDRIELLLSLATEIGFQQRNFSRLLVKELQKWSADFNKSGIQPSEKKLASIREIHEDVRSYLLQNGLNNLSNLLIHTFKSYHLKLD